MLPETITLKNFSANPSYGATINTLSKLDMGQYKDLNRPIAFPFMFTVRPSDPNSKSYVNTSFKLIDHAQVSYMNGANTVVKTCKAEVVLTIKLEKPDAQAIMLGGSDPFTIQVVQQYLQRLYGALADNVDAGGVATATSTLARGIRGEG